MDCADAKLRMEPCASGALVPQELALFEEHIAACEGCRLELELVRAMGSSAPGEPKSDDWTLDRIFGAAAQKDRGVPAADSTFASEPEAPLIASPSDVAEDPDASPATDQSPFSDASAALASFAETPTAEFSLFSDDSTAVPSISADIVATSESVAAPAQASPAISSVEQETSWDFEPADAKPEASLPEGSLFFAEETLARKGDDRKGQSTMKRMMFWGAGAVVGIALLVLSLWIGLFARDNEVDHDLKAPIAKSTRPRAPVGRAAPESQKAPASAGSTEDTQTADAPDVVTQPADEVVAHPLGARALSGAGVPLLSTSTRSGSQPVAPRSVSGAPAAASGKGDAKKPTASTPATLAVAAPRKVATVPENPAPKPSADTAPPASGSRAATTEEVDPEQLELRGPARSSTSPEQSVPFAGGAKSGDADQGVSARSPAPPPPSESALPAPADPSSAAPPADLVQRPIDRLHLATVTAEQGSDLVALRKIRDTWRGFVRTSVGPDRSRAKRELGDCLWATQALTGRTADKKDALAAYREYVLNAPAGGADSRTVARMRQLEDALSESN